MNAARNRDRLATQQIFRHRKTAEPRKRARAARYERGEVGERVAGVDRSCAVATVDALLSRGAQTREMPSRLRPRPDSAGSP